MKIKFSLKLERKPKNFQAKMDFKPENIVNFIEKTRKMLLTIITVIVVMIFIRSCINQIFDYKEEIEYLQKSLEGLYGRIGNITDCSSSHTVDTTVLNVQKHLLEMMHETEIRKSGTSKMKATAQKERYDFALETIGGRVVSIHDTKLMYTCSDFLLLIDKCTKVSPPEKAIQKAVYPGEAFCFQGNQGSITIKLACDVLIDSVTIEHVDRAMTPELDISDAPKIITVTGMNEKNDPNALVLGTLNFDPNVSYTQTFILGASRNKYRFLNLNLTENHGNPDQTCLYRIQVHGYSENC